MYDKHLNFLAKDFFHKTPKFFIMSHASIMFISKDIFPKIDKKRELI